MLNLFISLTKSKTAWGSTIMFTGLLHVLLAAFLTFCTRSFSMWCIVLYIFVQADNNYIVKMHNIVHAALPYDLLPNKRTVF